MILWFLLHSNALTLFLPLILLYLDFTLPPYRAKFGVCQRDPHVGPRWLPSPSCHTRPTPQEEGKWQYPRPVSPAAPFPSPVNSHLHNSIHMLPVCKIIMHKQPCLPVTWSSLVVMHFIIFLIMHYYFRVFNLLPVYSTEYCVDSQQRHYIASISW